MTVARHTKLSPALQKQVVKLLEQGINVEDVCSQIEPPITSRTYYNWRERGEKAAARLESGSDGEIAEDDLIYFQFFQATTRAFQHAKVKAVGAIYGAIQGRKSVEKTQHVFKEKRYRKGADGKSEPYDYERLTTSTKTIRHAPDPNIAIEYLKRRYPDEWSDRLRIDVDPAILKELQSVAATMKIELGDLLKALVEELKSSDD